MVELLVVDHVLGALDAKCGVRLSKITGSDYDHGLEQHAGFPGQSHVLQEIIKSLVDSLGRRRTFRHAADHFSQAPLWLWSIWADNPGRSTLVRG